jgi:hypothetical protein
LRRIDMDGWYYLHVNGELIFKRDLDGTAADIRESGFAVGLWPCDHTDRETAWTIVVEGLAAGAKRERVMELAKKWNCTDEDGKFYATRIGAALVHDPAGPHGPEWRATKKGEDSPVGYGTTVIQALASLAMVLGYKPSKMWGATFKDLLR